jgi:nucleoside-diphosphate-sugar epimerase
MKKVLVTGAAGCVGKQLVSELLERGFSVIAVDKPGSPLPDPVPEVLDIREIDLAGDSGAFEAAREVDVVVNLAAIVDLSLPLNTLLPVNLDAARNLYEGAAQGGCSLFIHISTGSLYRPSDNPLRETDPLWTPNDYARTKLLSEDYMLSRDPDSGPAVNILRPALIFGPSGRVLFSTLMTVAPIIRRYTGRSVRLRGGPRTNLVHSSDVARAICFLIEHPQSHGEVFNVANDDPQPVGDLLSKALEMAGIRLTRRSLPVSTRLLNCARPFIDRGAVMGFVNRRLTAQWDAIREAEGLAADGVTPRMDRESLDYASGNFVFDNSKLKALGFQYRYPDYESGWRQAMTWYCEYHWIPGPVSEWK